MQANTHFYKINDHRNILFRTQVNNFGIEDQ